MLFPFLSRSRGSRKARKAREKEEEEEKASKEKRKKETRKIPHLHRHQPSVDRHLAREEVGADRGLVGLRELFRDVLVHQRGLADAIKGVGEKEEGMMMS
jgi:hypothetical protein